MLLASGCASHHLTTAASTPAPPGCPASSGAPNSDRSAAAARYLAIATAGNQRLDIDFDRLNGPDHGRLAAAQADLRDAAATERQFDRCLLVIGLPPPTDAVAKSLFTVNEARADLTDTAAGSTSLTRLAGYEQQLTAANVPVEQAVTTIRQQLGLPPPATS